MEIFRCACNTEGIVLNWDAGFPDIENSAELELAFWQMGHDCSRGWKYRIIHAWRILRTGRPYADMIMMQPETAKAFANRILEIIKKEKADESNRGT